ncbi:MAG: hypothetical protein K8M05_18405, partial [Deltaproteobacteria bacterium]|nr:hypothetical protein [Kofleriaceae bacterium]
RGAPSALGEHRQVLTHRRLRIALARATVVGTPRPAGAYTAVRWCSAAFAGSDLGVSSATSALLVLGKGPRRR